MESGPHEFRSRASTRIRRILRVALRFRLRYSTGPLMTFSLRFFRLTDFSGVARAVCGLVLLGLLGACTTFKTGSPIAQSKVSAPSASDALDVAAEAFGGLGFKAFSRSGDTLTMDRPASKTGEVLYGNWNDSISLERVVIEITPAEGDLYKIACFPYAVRNAGTGMEDIQRRVQTHSREYSRAMVEITQRLRENAVADALAAQAARAAGSAPPPVPVETLR